jgi:hypothetical protein
MHCRILRRAIRYGFTFEYQRTFINQLIAVLADQMRIFPEIKKTTNFGYQCDLGKKKLYELLDPSRIAALLIK